MKPKGLNRSPVQEVLHFGKEVFQSLMLELEVTVRINSTNQELHS